jgi:hypothetical protein
MQSRGVGCYGTCQTPAAGRWDCRGISRLSVPVPEKTKTKKGDVTSAANPNPNQLINPNMERRQNKTRQNKTRQNKTRQDKRPSDQLSGHNSFFKRIEFTMSQNQPNSIMTTPKLVMTTPNFYLTTANMCLTTPNFFVNMCLTTPKFMTKSWKLSNTYWELSYKSWELSNTHWQLS